MENRKPLSDEDLKDVSGGMTIEEYCDKMGYYDMRPKEHAKGDIRMYRQAYPEATLHMSDGQVLDAIYSAWNPEG